MIRSALHYIQTHLEQALRLHMQVSDSLVVVNPLLAVDGTPPLENKNKLIITLINVDHETHRAFQDRRVPVSDGQYLQQPPSLLFNIDLLFTANFDHYDEALKVLDAVLGYFQYHPVFNRTQYADLPQGIDRLTFEIENASYFETHNLWSAMGAKYQPSVIYKVRHLRVQSLGVEALTPEVGQARVAGVTP